MPQVDVAGSYTFKKSLEQAHVCPPSRYILPSAPMAPAALVVAADMDGSDFQGMVDESNSCERSMDRKSVVREVSDSVPPRKNAVLFA